jgi:hypothetical protein
MLLVVNYSSYVGSRKCIAMALDESADRISVEVMKAHPENWRINHHCLMVFRSLTYFRQDAQVWLDGKQIIVTSVP